MKNSSSKFNVASRVSPATTKANPDDLLFASAPVAASPATESEAEELKLRFGSQLPAATLVKLHRVAYWSRTPLNELLDEALGLLYAAKAEADKPLPEKEREKRKMPFA
ncbi:hypothetical protein [Hymenobacter terrenus]|uniref:hypothetical protein n=1 Tax=Hymenobacter terrenus TaxID=1629124 RepID=UPI000619B447|nr:hypothetical protein [Hymenobacter terrenus]